ncbi:hypothetical protein [Clostridium sp.]|uniref:hypothetical protein n=1 Tax=Clostridium sp. TaxID=1506 RepID=UPI003D6CE205
MKNLDWNRINPATGPDLGVLGSSLKENFIKILPIVNGQVEFSDKIKIPICPMIGVIGTAPKTEPISCGTPGMHGGNNVQISQIADPLKTARFELPLWIYDSL